MTLAPGDPQCEAHGWMGHVFVHEAAHAVAALDRGIPFRKLEIVSPYEWSTSMSSDGVVAGGVHMHEPTSSWVDPNPRAVAEMCVAGYLAEVGAYGHNLPGSWKGDARMLAILLRGDAEPCENATAAAAAAEARMGGPLKEIQRATRAWLVEAFPRIRAVAQSLAGQRLGRPSMALIDYNSGPWSLTYDEVVSIAGSVE